jgi:hypothetical protein
VTGLVELVPWLPLKRHTHPTASAPSSWQLATAPQLPAITNCNCNYGMMGDTPRVGDQGGRFRKEERK